jgi:SecD/SecF fusion protein
VCNYDKSRNGRRKGELAMKNQKSKGILIIFAFICLFAVSAYTVFYGLGAQHKGKASHIRLGLDLAGGVSITYQIKDSNV